jgi:ankyrin repeat protein
MVNGRRTFLQQTAAGALAVTIGNAMPATHEIFEVAEAGNVARATELVNAEPEITRLRAPDGRTALHYATAAGKPEMVMFLQGRGSDLSAGPESPLLAAVDYPDQGIAITMSRILLENASDPNARMKDGRSALKLAASRGYGEIAELLIHRGARVSKDDIKTAMGDAVAVLGRADTIEKVHFDRRYIQDAHGKPVVRDDLAGQPWTLVNQLVTVAHSDFGKVKNLVEAHPALLNTRASWDETPIEAAAHMGLVPMAEWLADRGAAVSTCTAVLLVWTIW